MQKDNSKKETKKIEFLNRSYKIIKYLDYYFEQSGLDCDIYLDLINKLKDRIKSEMEFEDVNPIRE